VNVTSGIAAIPKARFLLWNLLGQNTLGNSFT
jgi:hypothetical protein